MSLQYVTHHVEEASQLWAAAFEKPPPVVGLRCASMTASLRASLISSRGPFEPPENIGARTAATAGLACHVFCRVGTMMRVLVCTQVQYRRCGRDMMRRAKKEGESEDRAPLVRVQTRLGSVI